jgi:hypothetical protein
MLGLTGLGGKLSAFLAELSGLFGIGSGVLFGLWRFELNQVREITPQCIQDRIESPDLDAGRATSKPGLEGLDMEMDSGPPQHEPLKLGCRPDTPFRAR